MDGLNAIGGFVNWFVGGGPSYYQSADNGASGSGGGTQIQEVHVHVAPIDMDEASSQIAAKIQPGLREALRRQTLGWNEAARRDRIARAVGGMSSPGGGGDF